jgi:hypothetical protein
MLRRSSLLLILAATSALAACNSVTGTDSGGTPIGVVLMNARTTTGGYTTAPLANFYGVSSATFVFSNVNSDTCAIESYDTTSVAVTTPQLGAGAYVKATVSGTTDSLVKGSTGNQTYRMISAHGSVFNPGDSVTITIPGDQAGFPALTGASKTAEPFTIAYPVLPPAGQPMIISWTPATDGNAAMFVSLIYAKGGTTLNTEIFCDFHDDGQGTVQATLIPDLRTSGVPFVLQAQRLRSNLFVNGTTLAYLNIISTFDYPTPVSP